MATKIDTQTARDALTPRSAPYWQKLRDGLAVGYRKLTEHSLGTWVVRYRDDNNKYQLHTIGTLDTLPEKKRYDEAARLAIERLQELASGGQSESITVKQACARYVDHLREEGKEGAAKDAIGRFNRWVNSQSLASIKVRKLKPGQLSDWRVMLANAPLIHQDKTREPSGQRAESSINRDVACLRAALNLALEDGYAATDGAWRVKLKPIEGADRRREVYLDPEQRRALIAAAAPDMAAFIKALTLLPLRPGAVAGLIVGNFDKRLGVLTIGKDKAGKDRKITLPPATAAFFAEQAKDKLPAAPLLSRADGKAWHKDAWKTPFKEAAAAAGLPAEAVAYNLRHSAITDLIALHRLDTMTVAVLSGTSLPMIEKHYGHLLRNHAADALAKLAL